MTPLEEFTLSLSNLTGTEGGQGREGPFTGTSNTPQVGVLYRPAADNLSRRWQGRTSAAFPTACPPSRHFYCRGWPCCWTPLPSPHTVGLTAANQPYFISPLKDSYLGVSYRLLFTNKKTLQPVQLSRMLKISVF